MVSDPRQGKVEEPKREEMPHGSCYRVLIQRTDPFIVKTYTEAITDSIPHACVCCYIVSCINNRERLGFAPTTHR